MPKRGDKFVSELEAMESLQGRIDYVARDFSSGKNKYASIDAWKLGRLLGLDFHDTGDWDRTFWAYRYEMKDETSFKHPFAENIELLQGKIPDERYHQLASLAETIIENGNNRDLPLTKGEKVLLSDAYAKEQADTPDLILACTALTSSDGVELDFEVCIGDGGEPFDPQTPYDLKKGKGFDPNKYVEVD